jgi:transposase
LAADGVAHAEIARRFSISRQTVINWRARYESRGVAGLVDEDRSGRPRTLDRDRLIAVTLAPPPKKYGVTHWSSRLLATHLGIGYGTVARVWRDHGIHQRLEQPRPPLRLDQNRRPNPQESRPPNNFKRGPLGGGGAESGGVGGLA